MDLEGILVRALNRERPIHPVSPSGLFLGTSEPLIGRVKEPFSISATPAQHSFVSGRTGSGKSTLLLRLMLGFLLSALGFLFVDFHGPTIDALLAAAATLRLRNKVVLLEPWAERVIGWNPLAVRHGESPYAIVQELVAIFRHIWRDSWGPRLEELSRMVLLALAAAELTLTEAATFLSRPDFRRAVLRRVSISEVREYWTLRFERMSPSQRALVCEPLLNKVSIFAQDPTMRYVLGQQAGNLDFDRVLREGQTVLGNLSTGALRGNNFLLASLLVAAFKHAVYRRAPESLAYAVLLDEFQEMMALDALDDYLRSFRKSKVSVYLATQVLQLPPELKSSIFGNCSRFFAFATSAADASAVAKEFGGQEAPLVEARLPELRVGECFVKVRGETTRLLRVARPDAVSRRQSTEAGRELCLQIGKSRGEIDAEIEERRRRFVPDTASRNAGDVRPDDGTTDLPEGYEDF